MTADRMILFDNVSKFYGEVLGVNRISLKIPPGITSLVGPNGSGKTTLMNLLTGLIRPTQGSISVLGLTPDQPEQFFQEVGYCTQFDSFPKGATGREFVYSTLRFHGRSEQESARLTTEALQRVNLMEAADRKAAGYSKGMRQRLRLAQSIAHQPSVIVLDEPLNGLDPMARAETMDLFRSFGQGGMHVIISSHILHEVDQVSDQVILLSSGYVVAEGQIRGVRDEVKEHPMQILIRCDKPNLLASRVFLQPETVEAKIHPDGKGLLVRTRDPEQFYLKLNRIVLEDQLEIESVTPTDDDVNSVYQYLIGSDGETV